MAVFSIVYSRLSDRLTIALSALASGGAFLLSLYVLQRAALSFGSAWIMGFLAISIGLIIAPNKVPPKLQIRYPRWDLPACIFSATAMDLKNNLVNVPGSPAAKTVAGMEQNFKQPDDASLMDSTESAGVF